MLIQPTLDALNALKLHGMAAALSEQMTQSAAQGLSFEERIGLLVEREAVFRENRRLTRLLQQAQLKERACLEDLDFRARRGLDRAHIATLTACDWIRVGQNLLIQGATGCGKTFLACALAHQACRQGLSALYVRAPRLFEELTLAHADGSFRKRLALLAKTSLLVIDDFAISPLGARERGDLLEILDDRIGARHAHHEPVAGRALVRVHRRPDARRCHPRSLAALRPHPDTRRRVDAQAQESGPGVAYPNGIT